FSAGVARPHPQYVYAGVALQRRLIVDVMRTLRELAGGAFQTVPSSEAAFASEETRVDTERYYRSTAAPARARIKLVKLVWDFVGTEFGGRQLQYEMFYSAAQPVVNRRRTTVIPGLIDSHCHVVLGDYTPRQKTVDFLDSYVHGGITSVVSAGEGVHAPGRPHDPVASKALAIAAAKCFANFRPNGMKVNAGSVVLEPGLTDDDFAEMARHGVRHAKYGFGGYAHPKDGEADIRRAQTHGLCVMSHSGGTSIPGSSPIT